MNEKTGDKATDKPKSPGADLTLEQVQEIVTRAPFHQWLGLKVVAVHDDGIEVIVNFEDDEEDDSSAGRA